MNYQTINVRYQEPAYYLQLNRPEANNAVNDLMIEELGHALSMFEESATIVVLEGLPEVFCMGADFRGIYDNVSSKEQKAHNPEPVYDLWLKLATGPFITISHVRGRANAGGVGFAAASDIVIADRTAQFSLSELLFGLFPACVMPFLIRRVGFQKAHYMTLMTHPVPVEQAHAWGLVDAFDDTSANTLRKHLLRLKGLSKSAVSKYKGYMNELNDLLIKSKPLAVASNYEAFTDSRNLEKIFRFVENGRLS